MRKIKKKVISGLLTMAVITGSVFTGTGRLDVQASTVLGNDSAAYMSMMNKFIDNGYVLFENQKDVVKSTAIPTNMDEFWEFESNLSLMTPVEKENVAVTLPYTRGLFVVPVDGGGAGLGFKMVNDVAEMAAYPNVPAYILKSDPYINQINASVGSALLNSMSSAVSVATAMAVTYEAFEQFELTRVSDVPGIGRLYYEGTKQMNNRPIRVGGEPVGYNASIGANLYTLTDVTYIDDVEGFNEAHAQWVNTEPTSEEFKLANWDKYFAAHILWEQGKPTISEFTTVNTEQYENALATHNASEPQRGDYVDEEEYILAFTAWEALRPQENDYSEIDMDAYNNAVTNYVAEPVIEDFIEVQEDSFNEAHATWVASEPVQSGFQTPTGENAQAYNDALAKWQQEELQMLQFGGTLMQNYIDCHTQVSGIMENQNNTDRFGTLQWLFAVNPWTSNYTGVSEDGYFYMNGAQQTANQQAMSPGITQNDYEDFKSIYHVNPYYTGTPLPQGTGLVINISDIPTPPTPPTTPTTPSVPVITPPANTQQNTNSGSNQTSNSPVSAATVVQSALAESKEYAGIVKTLTVEEIKAITNREPIKIEKISEIPTAKELFITAASLNRFDIPLQDTKAGTTPLRIAQAPSGSTYRMGSAVQGPECIKTMLASVEPTDTILRSFSLCLYKGSKQLAPTEVGNAAAQVSVVTSDKAIEDGFKYVLLCVESGGKVVVYEDTDTNPKTITSNVNNFGAFFVVKRAIE